MSRASTANPSKDSKTETSGLHLRFKSERERLGLSTAMVGGLCGVSETTVFNWEAGRSRIPLSVLEALWDHGLDPDRLIQSKAGLVALPSRLDDRKLVHKIPQYLLARYGVGRELAFVFHNGSRAANLLPEGELCLMQGFLSSELALQKVDGIVLAKQNKSNSEFICTMKAKLDGEVSLQLGDACCLAPARKVSVECTLLGLFVCRIGNLPAPESQLAHEEVFADVVRKLS